MPTTTIGSFPQTAEVRAAAGQVPRGELDCRDVRTSLSEHGRAPHHMQETLGLDVLVHGEFERNDMVEYFGEQLDGLRLHRETAGCRATARAA